MEDNLTSPEKKEVKRIQLPREILIGDGVIAEIAELCKKLNMKRSCLLVMDKKTEEIAGNSIFLLLEKEMFHPAKFYAEDSSFEVVEKLKDEAIKADFLIGIGGGKSIDVAKLASFWVNKPFISVPTVASHDGIASPHTSIKKDDMRHSVKTNTPTAIVTDTQIIKESPNDYTISGFGDAISNYTAVLDWKLGKEKSGEYYGDYAASLSLLAAEMVMENAEKIRDRTDEGIRILLEALISSGVAMSIANSSRPCSGSEHLFSHVLDNIAKKPNLHGKQCGVGTIISAYLHKKDWKKIKMSLQIVGAPVSLKELEIQVDLILLFNSMKELGMKRGRHTILEEITEKEFIEAGKVTGVF